MNTKKFIALTCFTMLGLYSNACQADALDDLLKQLEEAELKPAAKKAPAPPTSKEIKVEQKEPIAKPASKPPKSREPKRSKLKSRPIKSRATITPAPRLSKPERSAAQPRPVRQDKAASKREQRIISFFQTKISPIAEGMFKLVESKETQQLVETAKKKRLEFEKTIAAKAGKGPGAKPRYSTTGSSGGRGGYGGAGKGFDGGFGSGGGFGKGGWGASGSASSWDGSTRTKPFDSATSKIDTDKKSDTSPTATSSSKSSDDTYHGSTAPKDKPEDTTAPARKAIDSYTADIDKILAHWIELYTNARTGTEKDLVADKALATAGNVVGRLKDHYEERHKEIRKLSQADAKQKESEIKQKEADRWKELIKQSDGTADASKKIFDCDKPFRTKIEEDFSLK